jgi:hypothetical protein
MPQQHDRNDSITASNLLLVEGKDEANFCRAFLATLNISAVQIIDVGGRFKFSDKIHRIPKIPGFDIVKVIGILRDAEENFAQSTFDSVCSDLKRAGLPKSEILTHFSETTPSIGIFIMPDNNRAGMLEDLCLKSLSNTDEILHIDNFMNKVSITDAAKDYSKRRVQAWLSITQKDKHLQREIGRAAEAAFWDFTHPCFNELKTFLENFR